MNGMYEELLEKLRKNNRMSGWTHIDRLIDEAAEAIEALQQEIEQLKDENASLRNWNACEEKLHNELLESDKRRWELESELEDANNYREGLEAIVDKLREQVARMREALEQEKKYCNEREGPCEFCKIACKTREALELIRQYAKDGCYCFVEDVADEALSTDTVQDYHNPADVEILKKIKWHIENYTQTGILDELDCAIAEIDKQIGGKDND